MFTSTGHSIYKAPFTERRIDSKRKYDYAGIYDGEFWPRDVAIIYTRGTALGIITHLSSTP